MRRTRLWIGLPVFQIDSGERLGTVSDVFFDINHHVKEILLEREGILTGKAVVPVTDIKSVGEDAITIESIAIKADPEKNTNDFCLLNGEEALIGKDLYTEGGAILGTVADVYIGAESDNIVGYEVSDGLLADLVAGRKWLPFAQTVRIGDQIIVKADAKLSELQHNFRGE